MDGNYSLSDIAAVTDGGMGNMGGGWFVWILLFALFGGGGFGFNRGGNPVTEADLCNSQNFNNLQNAVGRISDNQAAIARQTDNAICQLGYQSLEHSSALSAQMASCCCDLKTAIHAEGEATRNMIQQDKIESLQAQVSALQLNQALCGVIRYPTSTTYATTCNPFFGGYSCGYNTCGNF